MSYIIEVSYATSIITILRDAVICTHTHTLLCNRSIILELFQIWPMSCLSDELFGTVVAVLLAAQCPLCHQPTVSKN